MDELEQRFPYAVTTHYPYMQVVPWVEENIGTFDRDWYRYGSDIASGVTGWEQKDIYRFRTEQDAVIFRLKWS
jgi:hypothetical protein